MFAGFFVTITFTLPMPTLGPPLVEVRRVDPLVDYMRLELSALARREHFYNTPFSLKTRVVASHRSKVAFLTSARLVSSLNPRQLRLVQIRAKVMVRLHPRQ
jgi:hypothetical protein